MRDIRFLKAASANVFLRGLSLLGKFVLLFFLARYLTPAEVGVYGLFVVTIGVALYALGMDFYTFNTRELLARDQREWAKLVRDQFAFHMALYLVVLPLILTVFFFGVLSWKYAFWFYVLLVLEHISQELYRILIVLSRPLQANVVLFLRSGAWTYVLVVLMFQSPETRDLTSLWITWAVSVVLSLTLAAYWLRDLDWSAAFEATVDWRWIRKGALIALPFLGGTLALRGILTVDRYVLQHYWGNEAVGVYTFYANIANAIQVFVDTGVITLLYPRIVAAFQQGQTEEYRRLMRRLTTGIILLVSLLFAVAAVSIYPILGLLQKPIYTAYLPAYWVLLTAMAIMAFGMIPHYALYVRRLDKAIVNSTVVGFGVALVSNMLLVPTYGILGAAVSTLAGMLTITALKLGINIGKGRSV